MQLNPSVRWRLRASRHERPVSGLLDLADSPSPVAGGGDTRPGGFDRPRQLSPGSQGAAFRRPHAAAPSHGPASQKARRRPLRALSALPGPAASPQPTRPSLRRRGRPRCVNAPQRSRRLLCPRVKRTDWKKCTAGLEEIVFQSGVPNSRMTRKERFVQRAAAARSRRAAKNLVRQRDSWYQRRGRGAPRYQLRFFLSSPEVFCAGPAKACLLAYAAPAKEHGLVLPVDFCPEELQRFG